MRRRKVSGNLCGEEKFVVIFSSKKSLRSFSRRRKWWHHSHCHKNPLLKISRTVSPQIDPGLTTKRLWVHPVSPLFHPVFTPDSPNYTELRHFDCCFSSDWPWTHLETTFGSPPSHPCFTPYSPNCTELRHFEYGLTSDGPRTYLKMNLGSPPSQPRFTPFSSHGFAKLHYLGAFLVMFDLGLTLNSPQTLFVLTPFLSSFFSYYQ